MSITILIQLILAHILTDFVFQTNSMVEGKKKAGLKSSSFWIHICLSGVLTYLILMRWDCWEVPLFIMTTHTLLDYYKIKQEAKIAEFNGQEPDVAKRKSGIQLFLLDQLYHFIAIVIAWLYLTGSFGEILLFIGDALTNKVYITTLTATIFIVWPAGLAIGVITEPFRNELADNQSDSLSKAGSYIGVLERLLTFCFVLLGQFSAIGFLFAAKSILRISKDGEQHARKKTEYVLIGSLMSFATAIAIGLLTNYIIEN